MSEMDSQVTGFSFTCDGVGATLLVSEWQGEEGLNRPYRFEVLLATTSRDALTASLCGARARLTLTDASGTSRAINGMLTEVEQRNSDAQYAYYKVVLMPRLSVLSSWRLSNVYLDMALPELIGQVMKTAGLPADSYRVALAGPASSMSQQNFVCQYEEDCLQFLTRRLARVGAYYYFEQSDAGETAVFISARGDQASTVAKLAYRPPGALASEKASGGGGAVEQLGMRMKAVPKTVVLRDFAASHAALQLMVTEPVSGGTLGEKQLFGEHFDTEAAGRAFAQVRAQALACEHSRLTGTSDAVDVGAGLNVEISGHTQADCTGRFYVLEVSHRGGQPLPGRVAGADGTEFDDYRNSFVALPAGTQFRPDTPPPRTIDHVVTAHIDGEGDGQYAQLDENGCYKVIFPFAATTGAPLSNSAWIRLATPSAGARQGMHFPLLPGTEVVVQFLNGDPDRPVITGVMVNSESPNVVTNANATQNALRTAGGNAMVMEDRQGAQQILLSSPTATSAVTIGSSDAPGLCLTSAQHTHLGSATFTQEVGGLYSRVIGGDGLTGGQSGAAGGSSGAQSGSGGGSSGGSGGQPASVHNQGRHSEHPGTAASSNQTTTWGVHADSYSMSSKGLIFDQYYGACVEWFAGNYTELVAGVCATVVVGVKIDLTAAFQIDKSLGHEVFREQASETAILKEITFGQLAMTGVNMTSTTESEIHNAALNLQLLNGENQLWLSPKGTQLTTGGFGLTLLPVVPEVGAGAGAAADAAASFAAGVAQVGEIASMTNPAAALGGAIAGAAAQAVGGGAADAGDLAAAEVQGEVVTGAITALTGTTIDMVAETAFGVEAPAVANVCDTFDVTASAAVTAQAGDSLTLLAPAIAVAGAEITLAGDLILMG